MVQRDPASIRVVNIHKSFRDGRDKVLNGISIDFPPGKLTYILGPSGTGKSVLIKHILGLLHPDSGEVWVDGKNLASLSQSQVFQHRMIFGMLFQNAALFDDFTVFENVAFPLREHTKMPEDEIRERVTASLVLLGMKVESLDKFPNELSGGMRKRVGLARAIIREPAILLYDEPTTGLDPVTRTTVDDLIATLKRELSLTSIVISHDIPSALRLADRVAFLYGGNVVFWGEAKDFKNSKHEVIQEFLQADYRTVEALTGKAYNPVLDPKRGGDSL
jgi:phospholipid/cholesterol/gamma-HCH transport system ATP-binding protein